MKKFSALLVVFSVLLSSSCRERTIVSSVEELKAFLSDEENGLVVESHSRNIETRLSYYPKEIIILNNYDSDDVDNTDSLLSQLKDYLYFKLSLSRDGQEIVNALAEDPDKFSQGVNYLTFGIAQDLKLYVNDEEFSVEDIAYARSFGASNSSDVLVAFKPGVLPAKGEAQVRFEDTFFRSGDHRYTFNLTNLHNTPTLTQ
jgi:hypothetical protein